MEPTRLVPLQRRQLRKSLACAFYPSAGAQAVICAALNMSKTAPVTIVNVGYRSTNYWVISAGTARLLIDLGYPGTMGTMRANLKRMGVPLNEIRYGLATHYHIDHAGLAQELKLAGMPLLVLETQVAAIPQMKRWTKPQDQYVDITLHDNVVIAFGESRALLNQIGLVGEIFPTPGHSDDSVSLLLDDGSVFTGDLTPLPYAGEDEAGRLVVQSWQRLREYGATRICPGHGPIRLMETGT
jgi:glyoxylase-like metal-dependent hydrolase (beta-lactamase superfamily II)